MKLTPFQDLVLAALSIILRILVEQSQSGKVQLRTQIEGHHAYQAIRRFRKLPNADEDLIR